MYRLRFAPSPTGLLHIGGLRTLLYNYMYAKQNKGQFILRIEDTDSTRTIPGSVENLVSVTNWLGIPFDEGPHLPDPGPHAPYTQSQRLSIYREYADQLLSDNTAYHCFCPPKRDIFVPTFLPQHRCACRDLSPSDARGRAAGCNHVTRLKTPDTGYTVVEDRVFNAMSFEHSRLDDVILMKSNGFPSYHLANVVDDHLMEISHVLRGSEWLSSLPLHALLYQFLSWERPIYAHLPLLLDETSRTKISKRRADTCIQFFKDEGYLPAALINAVSLVTYRPRGPTEVLSREELVEGFRLEGMHTSNAGVSLRKFGWFNKMHLERMIADDTLRPELVSQLEGLLSLTDYFPNAPDSLKSKQYLDKVLLAFPTRIVLLKEIPTEHSYLWKDPSSDLLLAYMDSLPEQSLSQLFLQLISWFEQLDFSQLQITYSDWASKLCISTQQLLTLLRTALSGYHKGPSIDQLISILGRERVLSRLQQGLETVRQPRAEINP